MRCPALVLVVAALLAPRAAAQDAERTPLDAAVESVRAANLEKHVRTLASDELEGRNAGYPGNDKATEYIAGHFRALGLKPVGDSDGGAPTYWQHFALRADKPRRTRNCVGYLEGADEKLREEVVVIGAHHDHVGRAGQINVGRLRNPKGDPEDKIWNGADDNASGTAVVLEIARAFLEAKVRPKRSILFMTFSAEEHNLKGSEHYVANPIFPLKNTVAMINLDMVGRNPARKMEVGGVSTSPDWEPLAEAAAPGTGVAWRPVREVSAASDHYSFAQKRIPAIHFFTGFHEDYHCQSDHADRLAYANMEKIARFGARLLALTADAPERPRPSFKSPPKRLGISGEDLKPEDADDLKLGLEDGGIRIGSVAAGSPAEAAGIRTGDVLVEFNRKKLPRDGAVLALREFINAVVAGADVPVTVLRDGGRVELTVRWDKSED